MGSTTFHCPLSKVPASSIGSRTTFPTNGILFYLTGFFQCARLTIENVLNEGCASLLPLHVFRLINTAKTKWLNVVDNPVRARPGGFTCGWTGVSFAECADLGRISGKGGRGEKKACDQENSYFHFLSSLLGCGVPCGGVWKASPLRGVRNLRYGLAKFAACMEAKATQIPLNKARI